MKFERGKLEVRKATARELYSVTVMTRKFFPYTGFSMQAIYKRLKTKRVYYYVALYDGHTVGFIDFKENAKSIKILGLAVLEEFRGNKIGQKLLDVALDFARKKRKEAAYLLMAEQNGTAARMYEKNGFRLRGRLAKKLWGMDVLLMEKKLR